MASSSGQSGPCGRPSTNSGRQWKWVEYLHRCGHDTGSGFYCSAPDASHRSCRHLSRPPLLSITSSSHSVPTSLEIRNKKRNSAPSSLFIFYRDIWLASFRSAPLTFWSWTSTLRSWGHLIPLASRSACYSCKKHPCPGTSRRAHGSEHLPEKTKRGGSESDPSPPKISAAGKQPDPVRIKNRKIFFFEETDHWTKDRTVVYQRIASKKSTSYFSRPPKTELVLRKPVIISVKGSKNQSFRPIHNIRI